MGQIHRWLGLERRPRHPRRLRPRRRSARSTPATSPTARTTSSASTTCATTWRRRSADKVQRGHVYAIVDEVDSILIDEARTPLIISRPRRRRRQALLPVRQRSSAASSATSTTRSTRRSAPSCPTEAGIETVEQALGVENLYDEVSARTSSTSSRPRCKAKELYKRDKDYIVQHGEVKIVDEFTGRILEGRRWSEGLHQAVEAKEGVKIKEENQTLATITLQNYFRMYDKLAGMTGTAADRGRPSSRNTYDLAGRADPDQPADGPRRPGRPHLQDRGRQVRRRRRRHRRALRDGPAGARRHDLGREVREARRGCSRSGASRTRCSTPSSTRGRPRSSPRPAGSAPSRSPPTWPAAASTSSSAATPRASPAATCIARGPRPRARDEGRGPLRRAAARASRPSAKAEGDKVRELGGLYVLGTERHESRRIDNQLRGRSGRQGDPGESRFYLSLEDELMRLFATGAHELGDGQGPPRRRADRGEDGHQGHRAGAEHRRAAQRRDPQERPQVRRGDERAAQGHLPAPRPDPRRRRPARRRRSSTSPRRSTR